MSGNDNPGNFANRPKDEVKAAAGAWICVAHVEPDTVPNAMPIVIPMAPTACEADSVTTVRRWTAWTPTPRAVTVSPRHRSTGGSSRTAQTARQTCLGSSPAASASAACSSGPG